MGRKGGRDLQPSPPRPSAPTPPHPAAPSPAPRPPGPSKHGVQAPPRGTRRMLSARARRAYRGPQVPPAGPRVGAAGPHSRLGSAMVSSAPERQPRLRRVYSRPPASLGDRGPDWRRPAQAPPCAPGFPRGTRRPTPTAPRPSSPSGRVDRGGTREKEQVLGLTVAVCREGIFFPRKFAVGGTAPALLTTISKRVC